jgi:hypothetical protein
LSLRAFRSWAASSTRRMASDLSTGIASINSSKRMSITPAFLVLNLPAHAFAVGFEFDWRGFYIAREGVAG